MSEYTSSSLQEQLNPSPSVKGGLHEQVKLSLSNPSRSHLALGSQGSLRHGSGTEITIAKIIITTHAGEWGTMHIIIGSNFFSEASGPLANQGILHPSLKAHQ